MDQILTWLDRSNISALTMVATIALLVATSLAILVLNRLLRQLLRQVERRLHLPYETVLIVTRFVTGSLVTMLLLLNIGVSASADCGHS